MSAGDQVLIACVEALDVLKCGYGVGLPFRPAVALFAGENQIPNAVEVVEDATALKRVRNDVINVGKVGVVFSDADVPIALEAGAPLVAVQRTSTSGDLRASVSGK